MTAKDDPYKLLGVERTATGKELREAYRKQALRYHPENNPGDGAAERKFKQIAEAYELLQDPKRRTAYDRFGHRPVG
jgi:molecular chaperone DnaJ